MKRFAIAALAAAFTLGSANAWAQEPPAEALAVLVEVRHQVERLDQDFPGRVWPDFAPAAIPVLYVLPGEGTLLLGWGDELPDGFVAVEGLAGAGWRAEAERGAASTGVSLGGRGAAQVVVHALDPAPLIGTSVHEAFHVFQGKLHQEGRRFGQGENSFLVTRYPIFDADNEAGFALEGRILAAALATDADSQRTELAQRFVAVREGRQRGLAAELVEFEMLAELNEGLAQYTGLRALQLLIARADEPLRSRLSDEARDMLGDVDRITDSGAQSFRLRFYTSGAAMALALDGLAGDDWKQRLVEADLTLQDMLADVSGYRYRESALQLRAYDEFDGFTLHEEAQESVEALRAELKVRVDSALARPGVRVVISAEGLGGFIGMCGIDPQNLLQVDDGILFHTRWLRPCAGSALQGEFNTPVVQDQNAGTLEAVIGDLGEVRLSVDGQSVTLGGTDSIMGAVEVELESPGLTLRSSRADIEIDGAVLTIRPQRN
jgi:hypothetical protein